MGWHIVQVCEDWGIIIIENETDNRYNKNKRKGIKMAGENDILTRDENGDLAVRTVSSTESATVVNPDDVYTRDTDGNLCIRTTGSGGGSGGDQHNLGWYATPDALRTAHATATAGDWAIVGSTDTVWIWDTDTNAWKDSDQKGQVASVNGQTGTVVLTASDVGAATAAQGAKADTAVQPAAIADMETQTHASATYATKSELADKQDIIQYSTMPTASADNVGDIVQFVGTTTASYTNGYFYKCVSDGADPATYSWEEVEVQASSGGGVSDVTVNGTSVVSGGVAAITGMVKNWGSNGGLGIGSTSYAIANAAYSIAIGNNSRATQTAAIAIGIDTQSEAMFALCIGYNSYVNQLGGVAIGYGTKVYAEKAIQLGYFASNSDANTFKVGNANGNFEIMSADGTIPAARHAALPSADGTYVLKLVIADGVPTLSWVAE